MGTGTTPLGGLLWQLVISMALVVGSPLHAQRPLTGSTAADTPAPAAVAAPEKAPPAPPTSGAWTRVRIPDPLATSIVRRALDEAFRQLADPRCQALLDDFHDIAGRPLRERLVALDLDVQQYLEVITFEQRTRTCRDTIAYTAPGSRVVYLCLQAVERAWRQNPDHLVATLIHEMLHTLGLGENPPSSAEITARVLSGCGRLQARPKARTRTRTEAGCPHDPAVLIRGDRIFQSLAEAHHSSGAGPFLQRVEQPGARNLPVALGCCNRDVENVGHLPQRQPAEEPQLVDAALARVEVREAIERFVQRQDVGVKT
jgi:hypothetical protein